MPNRVFLIGAGGREHAIAWKLSQSVQVEEIFVYPGSYEMGQIAKVRIVNDIVAASLNDIAYWCRDNKIKLVVVGPEDPLADGIADVLKEYDILCFGPTKAGARIEWDKSWAKEFMRAWSIPTAKFQSFNDVTSAKTFINKYFMNKFISEIIV